MSQTDRLDEMLVLTRVLELGSLSAAARALNRTPSAVSKLVNRLEERLGTRLLQRNTRKLVATVEGRLFAERAREILADLKELEDEVGRAHREPSGVLKLSLSHGFGHAQVLPLLPDFLARYPKIRMDIVFAERHVDLVTEGFDAAVRIGAVGDDRLIARQVFQHRLTTCAAPAYLASRGTPATPAELSQHDCLLFAVPTTLNNWRFRHPDGRMETIQVKGPVVCHDAIALRALAAQGVGIIRTSDYVLAEPLASGALVPILTDYADRDAVPAHVVYPSRKHLAAKVRVFVDYLAAELPRQMLKSVAPAPT